MIRKGHAFFICQTILSADLSVTVIIGVLLKMGFGFMKRASVFVAVLFTWASLVNAEVYDLAGKSFDLVGVIKARGTLACSGFSFSKNAPTTFNNSTTMHFDGSNPGDAFQLLNDNLTSGGVVNGAVYERKNNKLSLRYAGADTPEAAAQSLVVPLKKKLAAANNPLGTMDLTVQKYSFIVQAKKDSITATEKVTLTAPYSCGTIKLNISRKLKTVVPK